MRSMIGMGFGGILNCFLDPIFIFYLNLGVAGASMATAISKLISFAILIYPYLTHRSLLRLSIRNFQFNQDIIGQIVSVGSSSMFRSGLAVVSAIILNNIAGDISDSVLAGVGVSTKIMMFPFGVILGFGTGFQPVAGFNWGAKQYGRVRESFRFASRTAIAVGLAMGLALALGADGVIALFAEADPEMEAVGALCIRLQCLAMPITAGWRWSTCSAPGWATPGARCCCPPPGRAPVSCPSSTPSPTCGGPTAWPPSRRWPTSSPCFSPCR